jgi:peptide/nickel transport system substrate-binding protein
MSTFGLVGDSAHPESPFSNIKVRQAVAYAIDTGLIAKATGYGFYMANNQVFNPASYAYNPAIVGYPYNPSKAKQLLTEAGYPSGFKTKITVRSGAAYGDMYLAAQGFLSAVGINAEMDTPERSLFLKTQTGGWNNALVCFDMPGSIGGDPGQQLTSRLATQSPYYPSHTVYIPTDYDTKLSQANAELDAAKRKTLLQGLVKMIIDDYCLVIPICGSNQITVATTEVHDFDMYQYGQWWIPYKTWLGK